MKYLSTVLQESPAQVGDKEIQAALSNIPKGQPSYLDGVIARLNKNYDLFQIYKVYHKMYS